MPSSCVTSELEAGVSVVVPVFNSERTLPALVQQLIEMLDRRGERYEIVLVNDSSRDRSWTVIQEMAAKHDRIRGFDLMRNFGQHNALLCGIRAAHTIRSSPWTMTCNTLRRRCGNFSKELSEGFDVVYGAEENSPMVF